METELRQFRAQVMVGALPIAFPKAMGRETGSRVLTRIGA